MVVTNLCDFGYVNSLVTSSNPICLHFVVNSPYQPTMVANIKYRVLPNVAYVVRSIAEIELLNYKTEGSYYYFTADIRDIVNTLFTDNLDDKTISPDTFEELTDNIFDISVEFTVSNGVDADITDSCTFTVLNSAVQFGQSNIISSNRSSVAQNTTNETVYAGNGNVFYLYCITSNLDVPTLTPFAENILIDSDTSILTSNENEILTE